MPSVSVCAEALKVATGVAVVVADATGLLPFRSWTLGITYADQYETSLGSMRRKDRQPLDPRGRAGGTRGRSEPEGVGAVLTVERGLTRAGGALKAPRR